MMKNLRDRLVLFCLAMVLGSAAAAFPVTAFAQLTTNGYASTGNAPAFNKAVQGESAGTVEGTVENAMNWIGNVICPLAAVGAGVNTVMQLRAGGKWLGPAATGVGLLSISGIIRLAEYFIVNTNSTGIAQ
jgi:hypothetical protein